MTTTDSPAAQPAAAMNDGVPERLFAKAKEPVEGGVEYVRADLSSAAADKDDYDLAYAIMEEMGLGFKVRNCSCGQLPCLRLKPIADALAKREAEVRADLPRATAGIDPVNTYSTVVESVQLLEAAGYGAEGKPNTLLDMVKEVLAAPRATGETTVEACLAELRKMFPDSPAILVTVQWAYQKLAYEIEIAGAVAVQEDSLADCMAQVRATRTEGETK
jgi:hypothetical protein